MIHSEIATLRLASQHIAGTKHTSPKQIVAWMVAMQAQDFQMTKWAIGVRLPGSTDHVIEDAINNADILRTHLLRPTWHFVAAEDIYWLLELTASRIIAAQRARDRELELTGEVYARSNSIIENALSTGAQLTREALVAVLNGAGIVTDQNRASHLLVRAEAEKIICSGEIRHGKPTYALLAERVPKTIAISREEALATLAKRYFDSRCPATIQDFSWWSGLPAADVRQSLEFVKSDFSPEMIGGKVYYFPNEFHKPNLRGDTVYLLPTYDEFTLSYTDRSASIPLELEGHMKQISDRGIFRPIIVVNGQVVGIWKRTIKKETVIVEIQLFAKTSQANVGQITQATIQFGIFLDKEIEIKL